MTRDAKILISARHLTLMVISFVMLVPFYWVIRTAVTNENIYAYPPSLLPRDAHLFNFVDVWYLIPFPRYLVNSVIVSVIAVIGNVILTFIWSWNNFLWPLLITRDPNMQTLPLGLARFLSYMEDTTGALYAFAVMVLAPSILVFLMAQKEFIRGLTSGATKG